MSTEAPIASPTLPEDPAALKQLVLERDRRIAQLELDKLRLEHQLELLKKRYYGPRADKLNPAQLALEFALELEARPLGPDTLPPEQAAAEAQAPDPASIRRVRRGRRDLSAFDDLPVTTQIHDLPEEQKACPCCGEPRRQIGRETSWQAEYVPAHFQRIEHVRLKYACPACEAAASPAGPQIVTADKPAASAPIDKGMAGPGLLAYVVTSKYADYLPLYRLEGIFARQGLELDRSTLCVWAADVADLLDPLYRRMKERVLESHVIATDDTVMPMLAPQKTRQARLWVYLGDNQHPCNVFDFTLSRARDGPEAFLGNSFKGVLQADAYGGYEGICVRQSITQAGCWAHARRKFVDSQSLAPAIAAETLGLIGGLFAVERDAKDRSDADRLALRQARSRPLLERLKDKLLGWRETLLPKHPVAQAIGYALNQWEPLSVFATDGAVALDNNAAEREMKRIALNRKNSLFVGNQKGGRTAAVLSSITSTCRRHGIDPQLYLTQVLVNLPAAPISRIDEWLPDHWKQRQQEQASG
jgi:transposase